MAEKNLFLLFRTTPVRKGEWYYKVNCHKCSAPLYPLDDRSKGTKRVEMVGGGEFMIPCQSCLYEGPYRPQELNLAQATADWLPGGLEPAEPSGTIRSPLLETYPHAKPKFGPSLLRLRPEAAAAIGRCITAWTEVEAQLAGLLASILGAQSAPPVAALFLSIRSSRTQNDALLAAARMVLAAEDLRLLEAIMIAKGETESERNKLAHGHFGVSLDIQTGVVWIDVADWMERTVKQHVDPHVALHSLKRMFVYELGGFATLERDIHFVHQMIGFFSGYLGISRDTPWREERYRQLCSEPRIREALHRLTGGRKKKAKAPRGQQQQARPLKS